MGNIQLIIRIVLLINLSFAAVIPDHRESRRLTKRALPTLGMTCKGRRQATKFYADVHANCEFFYVCDYDNLMHFIQCPPGTIFSEDLQICNFPTYVKCQSEFVDNAATDYGRKINLRSDIPRSSDIPVLDAPKPHFSRIPSINRLTPEIDRSIISRPVGRRFPSRQPEQPSDIRPPFGRRNTNRNVNNPGIIHSFGGRQFGFRSNPNVRHTLNGDSSNEQPHLKPAPEPAPVQKTSLEPELTTTDRPSTPVTELTQATRRIRYYTRSPPTRAPIDYPPFKNDDKPKPSAGLPEPVVKLSSSPSYPSTTSTTTQLPIDILPDDSGVIIQREDEPVKSELPTSPTEETLHISTSRNEEKLPKINPGIADDDDHDSSVASPESEDGSKIFDSSLKDAEDVLDEIATDVKESERPETPEVLEDKQSEVADRKEFDTSLKDAEKALDEIGTDVEESERPETPAVLEDKKSEVLPSESSAKDQTQAEESNVKIDQEPEESVPVIAKTILPDSNPETLHSSTPQKPAVQEQDSFPSTSKPTVPSGQEESKDESLVEARSTSQPLSHAEKPEETTSKTIPAGSEQSSQDEKKESSPPSSDFPFRSYQPDTGLRPQIPPEVGLVPDVPLEPYALVRGGGIVPEGPDYALSPDEVGPWRPEQTGEILPADPYYLA